MRLSIVCLLAAGLAAAQGDPRPLPELGAGQYKGEAGGLYPGGANTPPPAHLEAGIRLAKSIRPSGGKIVMVSIGMSNTTQESQAFLRVLRDARDVNPDLLFVDCAQGGQTAAVTAEPDANYWKVAEERLAAGGVRPDQVQVAWLKQANARPTAAFPVEARKLQADLQATVRNLHRKYPNLKIVYLSSRTYGGYATTPLNPEPHAYETGFAVKWLIADQIGGKPELNFDSGKGRIEAPWLAWGPYLWAGPDKWSREDFGADGTHPTLSGRLKVARLLLDFLRQDATAKPWFLMGGAARP